MSLNLFLLIPCNDLNERFSILFIEFYLHMHKEIKFGKFI